MNASNVVSDFKRPNVALLVECLTSSDAVRRLVDHVGEACDWDCTNCTHMDLALKEKSRLQRSRCRHYSVTAVGTAALHFWLLHTAMSILQICHVDYDRIVY